MYADLAFGEACEGKYWNGKAISPAYKSQIEPDIIKAVMYNKQAVDVALNTGNEKSAATIQTALAFQHYLIRKYDVALAWLQKAESYGVRVGDEKVLAQVYHTKSMVYYGLKRTYDGLKMATNASVLFRKTGGHVGMAMRLA